MYSGFSEQYKVFCATTLVFLIYCTKNYLPLIERKNKFTRWWNLEVILHLNKYKSYT